VRRTKKWSDLLGEERGLSTSVTTSQSIKGQIHEFANKKHYVERKLKILSESTIPNNVADIKSVKERISTLEKSISDAKAEYSGVLIK